jgi:hypothetical protein
MRTAMALPRRFFYGCALRRARTAEESGIHGRSYYEPRAGYWRKHRDLFFCSTDWCYAPSRYRTRSNWSVSARKADEPFVALALPLFEQISSDQKVFYSTFAWWGDNLSTVEINGALSRNDIWAVTGNFYSELGATPELGRLIGPEDDDLRAASPTPIAVLAYNFWQRHHGGDRNVVGKVLKIEGGFPRAGPHASSRSSLCVMNDFSSLLVSMSHIGRRLWRWP